MRLRRGDARALAAVASLAAVWLALVLLSKLKDLTMRNLMRVGAAVAACALLAGCQSFSLADYAEAANDLDPGCYKDVDVRATPMVIMGWVLPVVSGSYRKVCNADQAPAGAPGPQAVPLGALAPGRIVGASQ